MSKAFTKESDDALPEVLPVRELPLPAGVPNYMTPSGAQRLRDELQRLVDLERPSALRDVNADDESQRAAARAALPEIERRILELRERLDRAEVVDPSRQDSALVRFGATVTVSDGEGREHRYRIVGVDETDARRGWISWVSPLAKALLGHGNGDAVTVRSPRRDEELEIVGIVYELE